MYENDYSTIANNGSFSDDSTESPILIKRNSQKRPRTHTSSQHFDDVSLEQLLLLEPFTQNIDTSFQIIGDRPLNNSPCSAYTFASQFKYTPLIEQPTELSACTSASQFNKALPIELTTSCSSYTSASQFSQTLPIELITVESPSTPPSQFIEALPIELTTSFTSASQFNDTLSLEPATSLSASPYHITQPFVIEPPSPMSSRGPHSNFTFDEPLSLSYTTASNTAFTASDSFIVLGDSDDDDSIIEIEPSQVKKKYLSKCTAVPSRNPKRARFSKPGDADWDVKAVINSRTLNGKLYYLVQWHDSWEPADYCLCDEKIQKYKEIQACSSIYDADDEQE
jgi:hypothetical protein